MTDEELIARLRDEHVAASRTEAADRIEALIAKLAENEVRLGKAVEALEFIDIDKYADIEGVTRLARAALAEIKGTPKTAEV